MLYEQSTEPDPLKRQLIIDNDMGEHHGLSLTIWTTEGTWLFASNSTQKTQQQIQSYIRRLSLVSFHCKMTIRILFQMIAKQIRWCFHDMILKYGDKLGTLRVASWSKTVWTCCDGMLTSSNDLSDAILSILHACRRCFASIRLCQHQRLWSVTFAPSASLCPYKREDSRPSAIF